MALTSTQANISMTPFTITELSLSTPVAGKTESIAHGGPSGATPLMVLHATTTRPTSWLGVSPPSSTASTTAVGLGGSATAK